MKRRDAYLEHLARVPLFQSCSNKELQLVARYGTDIRVEPGTDLVQEGRTGYDFFVIVQGKVQVTRRGTEVGTLGPGDFFGELSLLEGKPRNATVTALTPVEAVVVESREFMSLLEQSPSIMRNVLRGIAKRLHELDERT